RQARHDLCARTVAPDEADALERKERRALKPAQQLVECAGNRIQLMEIHGQRIIDRRRADDARELGVTVENPAVGCHDRMAAQVIVAAASESFCERACVLLSLTRRTHGPSGRRTLPPDTRREPTAAALAVGPRALALAEYVCMVLCPVYTMDIRPS